jgi:hypothetical protein
VSGERLVVAFKNGQDQVTPAREMSINGRTRYTYPGRDVIEGRLLNAVADEAALGSIENLIARVRASGYGFPSPQVTPAVTCAAIL